MDESPDRIVLPSFPSAWRDWLLALLVSVAAALGIVAIFAVRGDPSGHDFQFHGAMWLEVANQWHQGILLPRWDEWANWGFGEPRFIFYPPLSWMLGAAIGMVFGWKLAAGAFVVVAQTLAGVSMFALARRTLPLPAGLFASLAYAANPYALLVIYLRSDFAELLAAAFFPLLLLTLNDLAEAVEWRTAARHAARFALTFAAIWLCNAPAGVLASYSAALLFAWVGVRTRAWRRPPLFGAGAIGLGFGLCAFYLIPAAYEQRWVRIGQALSSGLNPSQNFLFTVIDDPEHNLFNWIASATAVGMILLTGAAGLIVHRQAASVAQKELWQRLMLLSAAAAALMISITSPLWQLLPELKFVQFPWRCMLVLAVPFAYFLAAGTRGRFGWIWVVLFLSVAGAGGTVYVKQTWWDADDIPTLQDAIEQGQGYEGTDEYDPAGDDHTDLPQNAPRAQVLRRDGSAESAAHMEIVRWTAEERILRVSTPKPARLALRLLDYPAWRVEEDGKAVRPEHGEQTLQMMLPLSGGTHQIHVKFERTTDGTAGIVLSSLALVMLLGLLYAPDVAFLAGFLFL